MVSGRCNGREGGGGGRDSSATEAPGWTVGRLCIWGLVQWRLDSGTAVHDLRLGTVASGQWDGCASGAWYSGVWTVGRLCIWGLVQWRLDSGTAVHDLGLGTVASGQWDGCT